MTGDGLRARQNFTLIAVTSGMTSTKVHMERNASKNFTGERKSVVLVLSDACFLFGVLLLFYVLLFAARAKKKNCVHGQYVSCLILLLLP